MQVQLNNAQLKAIYSQDPNIVVIAPAGAGKTLTMCSAIQEYITLHPTHSITAITFTRKAAAELTQRIGNPKVKTGTIHAWSLQRLNILGAKYGFTVELLEEEEMRRIMQQIAYRKNLKFVNIYQLYNYIVGNIKTLELDNNIVQKYEKIKAYYIQYKHEKGLYDFTDLPQYLLDTLNKFDEEIYDIDAFFVDEFQDIDEIQFKIFDKIQASKKFYIGDHRQAIYAFNGSLEDIFDRLDNAGFYPYYLNTNYRSKQSIMDIADSFRQFYQSYDNDCFITDLKQLEKSSIVCERGEGGKVYSIDKNGYCLTIGTDEDRPLTIISELLNDPSTMVLCRTNKQVRKLQALGINNCSTVHQAKGLEYNNVVLVDMLVNNQEELNIAYVGMTRAKNELCIINYEYFVMLLNRVQINPITEAKNVLF